MVTFNFVNCNNVLPFGEDELPHKSNFFYGKDSNKWFTNVPKYQSILYENIYDNIDLKYYFNEDGLKYDFIVRPDGDPNDIVINVEGVNEFILGSSTPDTSTLRYSDTLTVKTDLADIVDSKLFSYQENNCKIIKFVTEFN